MPTYKNHRSGALHLTTHSTNPIRTVLPGAVFEAHPDEVPVAWLRTKADNKSDKMIVEKLSELPEVPAPRKPKAAETSKLTIEQLREDIMRSSADTDRLIAQMRKDQAEELARVTEAAKATVEAATAAKPAEQPPKAETAAKQGKDAAKDEKKS